MAGRAARIEQIGELERAADRVTHETVNLLHKTFVTPFDRDDIHRLISRMDDILDLIQDAAESLMLYDIQQLPAEASHLADLVKTMGQRITKIKPVGGFSAETGGAMALFLASSLGIPVSTTHTITGSIIGVGSAQRGLSAVRWGVAGNIVLAWILTIPASAIMAAAGWWLGRFIL